MEFVKAKLHAFYDREAPQDLTDIEFLANRYKSITERAKEQLDQEEVGFLLQYVLYVTVTRDCR
jgi:hypothetical protein